MKKSLLPRENRTCISTPCVCRRSGPASRPRRRSTPVPCESDGVLFRQDEPSVGVFILHDGTVTLSMMSPDGHSLFAVQAKPGSILGLPGAISNQPYTLSATARAGAQVSFVSNADLTALMHSDPLCLSKCLKSSPPRFAAPAKRSIRSGTVFSFAVAPYITGMPGSRATHAVAAAARSKRVSTRASPRLHREPHLLNSVVVPLAGIAIARAYLLGSIPMGYLLFRVFRRQDIRSMGSGNIGATNVLRAGGKGLGAATFVLDVLKGCAAVWLGGYLASPWMPSVPSAHRRGLRGPLRRARPHVPHLAPVSRRQRRGHRFWSFSRHLPRGPLSPPSQSSLSSWLSPAMSRSHPLLERLSFPVFAWFLAGGTARPFSSPPQSAFPCSSSSSTTQTSGA